MTHKDPIRPPSDASSYCEGKFKFKSQPAAANVAAKQSKRRDCPVSAYHCPNCSDWHVGQPLTHQGKRR